jgi:hypothetical protein
MRNTWGLGVAFALCLMFSGASVAAQPSPTPSAIGQPGLTRTEAVELVLASDERFAGLADFEDLRRQASREFSLMSLLDSSYYRVLSTVATDMSGPEAIAFRYPSSWLIEVTLVEDCTDVAEDVVPWPDPCAWRHSWFHQVQPDGAVISLFDEGDPLPGS